MFNDADAWEFRHGWANDLLRAVTDVVADLERGGG
jgi:hypothetical protein